MNKFIILCIFGAAFVMAQEQQVGGFGKEFGDQQINNLNIPGVSEDNMQRLREQLKQSTLSPVDGYKKMDEWKASLPLDQKTAVDAHFSQKENNQN